MRTKTATIVESELIARLSMITGYHRQIIRDVIKAQTEFITDEISCGTPVRIGGLGEISTIQYKGRGGYNIRTKENLPEKELIKVKFKPSIQLKKAAKNYLNEQL